MTLGARHLGVERCEILGLDSRSGVWVGHISRLVSCFMVLPPSVTLVISQRISHLILVISDTMDKRARPT